MRKTTRLIVLCGAIVHAAHAADTDPTLADMSNDCSVRYQYVSGGKNRSALPAIVRGQYLNVERSNTLWVRNSGKRPIRVLVTVPTGGTKWVQLGEKQQDPPALNYIGNVTLKRIMCLHYYGKPYDMVVGFSQSETSLENALATEFRLEPAQVVSEIIKPLTDGRSTRRPSPERLRNAFMSRSPSPSQVFTWMREGGMSLRYLALPSPAWFPDFGPNDVIKWAKDAGYPVDEVFEAGLRDNENNLRNLKSELSRAGYKFVEIARPLYDYHTAYRARRSEAVAGTQQVRTAKNNSRTEFISAKQFVGGGLGEFSTPNSGIFSGDDVIRGTLSVYGNSQAVVGEIVAAFLEAWPSYKSAIAPTLRNANAPAHDGQIALHFKNAGEGYSSTAAALKEGLNLGPQQLATALKFANYSSSDVARGLVEQFPSSSTGKVSELAGWLRVAGYPLAVAYDSAMPAYGYVPTAGAVASTLYPAGYKLADIASFMKSRYSSDGRYITQRFKLIAAPEKVAGALKMGLGAGGASVALWFRQMNYSLADATNALRTAYRPSSSDLNSWLSKAGYNTNAPTRSTSKSR